MSIQTSRTRDYNHAYDIVRKARVALIQINTVLELIDARNLEIVPEYVYEKVIDTDKLLTSLTNTVSKLQEQEQKEY